MSGKLAGLRRRLAKVEEALAETAEQEKLADCICKDRPRGPGTLAFSNRPEEFEAEMNQTCPVHGFRHLGHIMAIRFVDPDHKDERFRLDELLEEYYARESQNRPKLEHDSQEA
jgi:hypothetical protein